MSTHAHTKSRFLTLQYAGASLATLAALYGMSSAASGLIQMWSTDPGVGGVYAPAASTFVYTMIMEWAIVGVMSALIAFFLYRKVAAAVANHLEYLHSNQYAIITNSMMAITAAVALVYGCKAIATVLTSLLIIGTSTSIANMYIYTFLPQLIVCAISLFIAWAMYKIGCGTNVSKRLSIVLLISSIAVLIAAICAVPIHAHRLPAKTNGSTDTSSGFDVYQ